MTDIKQLENLLNDFDPQVRYDALTEIAEGIENGEIIVPEPKAENNLHYHTFFSYNAYAWSPCRIAWEAKKYGLFAAGIVDFDVIDGMDEFLAAGEMLGLPAVVSMETRVYVKDYAEHEISSPKEPGVAYFMCGGCYKYPEEGSEAEETLNFLRESQKHRNVEMVEKINGYLGTVKLDYEADVMPLTPSGNATERHLLEAYDNKAKEVYPDEGKRAAFWAKALGITDDEAKSLIADDPKLRDKIRSKLMKFGGVGYTKPTPDTFPSLERVVKMVYDMGGIPTTAYLDGASSGEADIHKLLSYLKSKGTLALNIIPDRNYNFSDPEKRAARAAHLDKTVKAARELDMPIIIGTEMNKLGLPFVDNFNAPELKPYIEDFNNGAYIFRAHTVLAEAADMGYTSKWAEEYFGSDTKRKNDFYLSVGKNLCK
ncbi:MAG: hypothetical protein J6X38_04150 [Abditibacteriota bacterium]|nr:hypothetical protein [Abditibacteriota bacterium]